MALGKVAGTVGTDDGRQQILIHVAVVQTAEEREQIIVGDRVATAHARMFVARQRAFDRTQVGGFPGSEFGG